MGYKRRWKPSKTAMREFASQMQDIEKFCSENGITSSRNNDSYYFTINGVNYRVSNHSVAASNRAAYDEVCGKTRELYHPEGREENTVYIHAGKTRIMEIYNDLKLGYKLDGRGKRKES